MFHFHNVTLSTIFRWGEYFSYIFKILFLRKWCKNSKKIDRNFPMFDTNVLPPFYGSQCMYNSYNSYHRYTRTIKMLYFHNSFQYMQKSATYAAKSFQLLGRSLQTPWPGALPLDPAGAQPPDPNHLYFPIFAISPETQGVWIKPCTSTVVSSCLQGKNWRGLDPYWKTANHHSTQDNKVSGSDFDPLALIPMNPVFVIPISITCIT